MTRIQPLYYTEDSAGEFVDIDDVLELLRAVKADIIEGHQSLAVTRINQQIEDWEDEL